MATTANPILLASNIQSLLARLRTRIRVYIWLEGLALLAIWLGVMFWLAFALDYLPVRLGASEMPIWARGVLLAITLAGVAHIVYHWIVRRAFVPMPDRSMALLVERYFGPTFQDSLVTSVELNDRTIDIPEFSREMLTRTNEQAREGADDVRLARVFNFRPIGWKVASAAALGLSLIAFLALDSQAFQQATQRLYLLSSQPWPRSAFIEVVGIDIVRPSTSPDETTTSVSVPFGDDRVVKVAKGSNVMLRVRAAGEAEAEVVPDVCSIYYRAQSIDGSGTERGTVQMSNFRDAGAWRNFWFDGKPFKGVLASIQFDVVGYDHRVRDYRLEVVESPAVVETLLDMTFPPYMVDEQLASHLPVKDQQYLPSGTFVPLGTQVTIKFRANKSLKRAEVVNVETQERQVIEVAADATDLQRFEHKIESLKGNLTLEVSLVDVDNVTIERPFRVFLTGVEDQPPQVEVALKGIGTSVTPDVIVPLSGKVSDDYATDRTWFHVQVNDSGDPRQLAFALGKGGSVNEQIDFREQRGLEGGSELKPKDKLLLSVMASDRYDLGSEPHVGSGDRYQLDVVTPEELLAQLEVRELGLRRRYEQILDEMNQMRDSLLRVKASLQPEDKAGAEPEDLRTDDDSGAPLTPEKIAQRTAELRLLRLQRALQQSQKSAQEVLGVAAGFAGIREELINNRVDTQERKERLKDQIADPLATICSRDFPELDRRLTSLEMALSTAGAKADSASFLAGADETVAQANGTITQLDAVLQKMLDLETYNELLDIVRDIMSDQEKLLDRTKQERKRQALEDLK
jgi:hypothetical protein